MSITINRRDFTAMLLATGTTARYRRPVSTPDSAAAMPHATININMFSKGLEWMDYDALTDTLVAAGFNGIDLTVRGGGHVLPENVERDLPKIVEIAKAKGLAIPMMVTSIVDPGNPMTERILKTASQAGIKHYRMGYLSYDPKLSIQETFQKHKSTLQRLADLNHTYGIQAGYQNHQGTNLGASVWDIWYLVQELDNRLVSLQYDAAHAQAEGVNSWANTLRVVSPQIGSLPLKDYKWEVVDGRLRTKYAPIGEGMVNFKTFFQRIKEANLVRPFSLHFEYPLLNEADKDLSVTGKMKKIIPVLNRDVRKIQELWQQS